ncbi:MAG: hypothetical protein KBA95_18745 [Acidobacteria bacterium]|nr:hypothetical protein [Acidobacteriota bacterium]
MKQLYPALAAAVLAVGLAAPAHGGQVQIQIRDGRITLQARDASPREILAEWARVGQTRIVNAERVPGGPLTITLTDVPEAKALDLVLRSAGGYLAAPRAAGATASSQYDRIVVLAIARPPAGVPAPAAEQSNPANRFQRPARMRPQPQQPAVLLDDQDEPVPQEPEPMEEPQGASQPGMPTQPAGAGGNVPGTPASLTSPTPGMPTAAPSAARPGMPTPPPRTPGQEQQPPQESRQPQEEPRQ